ncbi:DUF1697 domain-containing protein [Sphingomonas sp. 1P06PA]|uniref:DUF1697 domain-containing protein n=1 Tax=Sphingomonas sp. 1P06PA TaxID=554121 RepID=UPI0039A71E96
MPLLTAWGPVRQSCRWGEYRLTDHIVLLRGVNVGATRKLPMADLRAALDEAGLGPARSYIQSGNLILPAGGPDVEERVSALIADRFGLQVPVVARTADQWRAIVAACPMRARGETAGNIVHVLLSRAAPAADAVERLRSRARDCEIIERAGEAIWIDFGDGAGQSRLAPAFIDKAMGSPATARNYRTALKLLEMVSS